MAVHGVTACIVAAARRFRVALPMDVVSKPRFAHSAQQGAMRPGATMFSAASPAGRTNEQAALKHGFKNVGHNH